MNAVRAHGRLFLLQGRGEGEGLLGPTDSYGFQPLTVVLSPLAKERGEERSHEGHRAFIRFKDNGDDFGRFAKS